jgi:hypothetical protein
MSAGAAADMDLVTRRLVSLFFAAVAWVATAWTLVASFVWGATLRCDDHCGGLDWRNSSDAWQWDAVVALGAVAFVAGTAHIVLVWRRRRYLATAALVAAAMAVLALAALVA